MLRLGKESKVKWKAEQTEEKEEVIHGQKVTVKVFSPPKAYLNGKPVDEWYYECDNQEEN